MSNATAAGIFVAVSVVVIMGIQKSSWGPHGTRDLTGQDRVRPKWFRANDSELQVR
jgi:hypothetical protein